MLVGNSRSSQGGWRHTDTEPNAVFANIPLLLQRAIQDFQRGNLAQAEVSLGQVLDVQPRNFDALHILGVTRAVQGHRREAIELFRKALSVNKNNHHLQFNLAKALSESGQHAEALIHHRKATQLAPQHAEAWLEYGQCLANLGHSEDALAAYQKSIDAAPGYAEAWNNKGLVLRTIGQYQKALSAFEQALVIKPAMAEAHYNMGLVLEDLDRLEDSLLAYSQAVEMNPNHAQAWNNKGAALMALDRSGDALPCFDRALAIRPDFPLAWNNKGSALLALERTQEAITCYKTALDAAPDYADARVTLGHLLLREGQFAAAWPYTEARWQSVQHPPRRLNTIRPRWGGGPSGHPLLLWGEQGIGDQILYGSILPELAGLPQRKMVALDKRLIPLFSRSMPGFEFVDLDQVSDAMDFAEQLPLGSLPALFRPDLQSFARAHHPLLMADPERTAALRARVIQPGKLVCGVSWWSNRKSIGRHKSLSLEQLLTSLASDNVHFVDLQYGDTRAERQALQQSHGITVQNLEDIDNFHDIDGLAALIQACDVVVTTSNSTAHLAGALGKQTMLLLPSGKGRLWYWTEFEGKNPWYPSIHGFPQQVPGSWNAPLVALRQQILIRNGLN